MRKLALPLLLAGTLAATGCQSGHLSAELGMHGGHEARVEVLGPRPFVEIRNAGPDPVWVDLRWANRGEGQLLHAGNSIGRGTSHGPIAIRVTAEEDHNATVQLSAQRANGLEIDGPSPSSTLGEWEPDAKASRESRAGAIPPPPPPPPPPGGAARASRAAAAGTS